MTVNQRLDAAQAEFGQDAATLSLLLNLRSRKVMLVKLRTGQWMTSERGNERKAFSTAVVQRALEMGYLRTEGVDKDGPSLLGLTYEGDKLAIQVLAWLKVQNNPTKENLIAFYGTTAPPMPRDMSKPIGEAFKDTHERTAFDAKLPEIPYTELAKKHGIPESMVRAAVDETRKLIEEMDTPLDFGTFKVQMPDLEDLTDEDRRDRRIPGGSIEVRGGFVPNIIEEARKRNAMEILATVLQQIGDEFLLETMYRLDDLRSQLRAGFERWGLAFDDLTSAHQEQVMESARASLEETHGWVMDPEDRRDL